MAWEIRTGTRRFEIAFAAVMTLSVLSKESFILTIPAVLLLKVGLTCRERDVSFWEAVKQSKLSISWLSALFVATLAIIRFVFATTRFNYAGWHGFDAERFSNILQEYRSVSGLWLLVLLLVILLIVRLSERRSQGQSSSPKGRRKQAAARRRMTWAQRLSTPLAAAILFWFLMTAPQLLLNMNSGMMNTNAAHFGRYVLPGIVGFAFLVATLVDLIQGESKRKYVATVILGCLLAISFSGKLALAHRQSASYEGFSRKNDQWFEGIVANSSSDGPIVLVFANSTVRGFSLQKALRVYYILSEQYGRANLYYCPVPPVPTLAEARSLLEQTDAKRHAEKMRSVDELENGVMPEVVLIVNSGGRDEQNRPVRLLLDAWLRTQPLEWFDARRYRRVVHRHGHVSFFLKE